MPKISADNLDEHRSQVQQRIFEALADLMTEHSFEAISMAQIAARAGLGRTAIYHHFSDREAVVVAFASHETTKYVERLRAALDQADGPVEEMRTYVRHNLTTGEQFHVGLGPMLSGRLSQESRLAIRDHVIAVEDVLRDILRAGVAAGDFVVEDEGATMALLHACLGPRHLPPASIEGFVLRGLGVADAR
ncbi:MAG: TetR/AcrR family transcriptional regulator [Nocardioides sp.]|uniref:TetR/AcrR family transcriptional regulator n=1 Tax=Nocardioides sp. TaxID=35761 RepID=UPI003EFD68FD